MTVLTQSKVQTYTTPSWSLAIAPELSPLSKWWGKPVARALRFTLVLKHQSDDSPLKIKGDHTHLEILTEVTEQYIEQLVSTPYHFTGFSTKTESETSQSSATAISLRDRRLASTHTSSDASIRSDASKLNQNELFNPPSLRSTSLLTHELNLGELENSHPQAPVLLSTTQIYDLAEALSQSRHHLATLPLSRSRALPQAPASWAKTAAVAAFALATTGSIAWMVGGFGPFQTASQQEPTEDTVASAPTPSTPQLPETLPEASPTISFNPQTSSPNPSAKPGSPTPNLGSKNFGQNDLTAQNNPVQNNPAPPLSLDQTKTRDTSPSPSPNFNDTLIATEPAPTHESSQGSSSFDIAGNSPANRQKRKQVPAAPQSSEIQESAQADLESRDDPATGPVSVPTQPALVPPPAPGILQESPAKVPGNRSQQFSPSISGIQRQNQKSARLAPTETRSALPAVQQIETYFNGQWQGQNEIKKTLSYTLVFNQNGTVKSISPLNSISKAYLNKVAWPSIEQAISTPFSNPNAARVVVRFYPNGSVSATLP